MMMTVEHTRTKKRCQRFKRYNEKGEREKKDKENQSENVIVEFLQSTLLLSSVTRQMASFLCRIQLSRLSLFRLYLTFLFSLFDQFQ